MVAAPFVAAPVRPGRGPKKLPKPNSIITGTGPFASAGVVTVSWMSTLISGHRELSTWPTSFRVTTGTSPTFSRVVSVTSQVTLGTSFGTRP